MAIHELVLEAYDENKKDRRSDVRYPFFRPVSIQWGGRRHAAFSREISAGGIGLLHNFKLTPCDLEITIPTKRGHSVRMRTRILWCRACGEGWCISGGKFLDVVGVTP